MFLWPPGNIKISFSNNFSKKLWYFTFPAIWGIPYLPETVIWVITSRLSMVCLLTQYSNTDSSYNIILCWVVWTLESRLLPCDRTVDQSNKSQESMRYSTVLTLQPRSATNKSLIHVQYLSSTFKHIAHNCCRLYGRTYAWGSCAVLTATPLPTALVEFAFL